jgi:ATP-binding cassette subfamily B protein
MVELRGYQEDALGRALDVVHVRRLWPFVRPYRRGLALALLILAASLVVEVAGPYVLRLAIDGPLAAAARGEQVDAAPLYWLTAAYAAVMLAGAGLGYAYAMVTTKNGQRVIRDVRVRLFGHMLAQGPRFFETNPAGKLVTRVTSDVENLNELITTGVLESLFDLMKIAGLLAVLFWVHTGLALFTIAVTPVIIAMSLVFRRFARDAYRAVRGQLARQNAFTAELVGGARTTKLFGQTAAIESYYRLLNAQTRGGWIKTVTQFALFFTLVDLVIQLTQTGLLFVGGTSILGGTLSIGVFVQFWLYFTKITDPIKELGEKYNVLQSAFASSERIFKILDTVPDVVESPDARPTAPGPARVVFENVHFAYRPDVPVLQDVSFVVEPGTTVAIVGPTGAGKSTILALLARLRDPSAGRVLLDGVDIKELQLASLRRRIAMVMQDVFLFSGTVLDNVRLFDPAIDRARVEAALAAVGASEFVNSLDQGLDAAVEERGMTFSQGERQLLSFARALAADPDVLVLDEATANIDTQSEARIQRGLAALLRGRTAIVVAHRLSTVRHADRILVVQHGRIVEAGRHDELMAQGGVYSAMVRQVEGDAPPRG